MKERPILFSASMVRALLDGSKTQTRRVAKGVNYVSSGGAPLEFSDNDIQPVRCPYGQTGDRLWVRETFDPIYPQDPSYNGGKPIEYDYQATYKHGDRLGDLIGVMKKWKPSIHMPRAASRITLEITGVRVEKLQDISEADAVAEGLMFSASARRSPGCMGIYELRMPDGKTYFDDNACDLYRKLWEQINGPGSWDANPWVWVLEFRRIK